ncbi:MAG: ChbG/HpnK family deacetylase [Chitinispirillaceae bacterium]
MLVINADDWGSSGMITSRIEECVRAGVVDTVSAMVFMKDSERASHLASAMGLEAGLHINFTTPFDCRHASDRLIASQQRVISYLKGSRVAQFIFNPLLNRDFDYVFKAQYDEYYRLYKEAPARMDGHNHMHLCANMLLGNFIPRRIKVRRNNHFQKGEKGVVNRTYRSLIDLLLERRYICTDYFLHIQQFAAGDSEERKMALKRLGELSIKANVELLMHPHQQPDYEYAMSSDFIEAVSKMPRGRKCLDVQGSAFSGQL